MCGAEMSCVQLNAVRTSSSRSEFFVKLITGGRTKTNTPFEARIKTHTQTDDGRKLDLGT